MRILKQLSEATGVSGDEGNVRRIIRTLIESHVDEVKVDTMGNLIAFKKGTGQLNMTVMVDAHMDEVGLMVNGYTGDGMLKFAPIGGIDDRILLASRVLVGKDRIPGVIGARATHLLSGGERDNVVKMDSMAVDIGASSRGAAEAKAPLGTRIAFDTPFETHGNRVRGKAFDDRAGCAVLVHLLQGERFPFDLYGVFAVQEEIGLRGAQVAAQAIMPDVAFILEGTIADDLPKTKDESPTTRLGYGPALGVMDRSTFFSPMLNTLFTDTAAELKIPVQFKQPGIGGTDAGAIHKVGGGVPVSGLSVPCRYIHSQCAVLDKEDYRNTIKLMRAALERLDPAMLVK